MLVPVTKINIEQVGNDTYPGRKAMFELDFVNEFETQSTWAHLTDTAKLKFPKNIYHKDENGNVNTWEDKAMIMTGQGEVPFFLRGDKITIEAGYYDPPQELPETALRFEGYITKINNRVPLQIECEDQMYLLKQTNCPNKVFLGKDYSAESMMKELIDLVNAKFGTDFVVKSDNYKTNIGDFRTLSTGTIAMVLEELRSKYHCESYFRKNASGVYELRIGLIKYYPEERVNHIFHFQKNIISDNLIYNRIDDIRIGVKAYSINKEELQTINKNGKVKTKYKRIETTAGDTDGEMRSLYFYNVTSIDDLKKKAEAMLPKLKYEGFSGDFTTFGLPFVKHGDSVTLLDDVVKERNNTTYLVKDVVCTGGIGGLRQKIVIDYRIDNLSQTELNSLQTNGV